MRDSWITEEQWATLDAARELRPKPMGALSVLFTIGLAIGSIIAGLAFLFDDISGVYPLVFSVGFIALVRWHGRRARRWLARFDGVYAEHERMLAILPGTGQAPALQYEMLRPQRDWERLSIDLPGATSLSIGPDEAPIGDSSFDPVLGFNGAPTARALLGGALRRGLPTWHAKSRLVVAEGSLVFHVGALGYDAPSPELDAICSSFQAYSGRLSAPQVGLAALATELSDPFDAARALAMLADGWPAEAETVSAALAGDPVGAAMARVATTGAGLLDPALDWSTRSAIGRGLLGADGSAQRAFVQWLSDRSPASADHAMLLVELNEAASVLNDDDDFAARALEAEQYLVEEGGPAVLTWMRGRAHLEHTARSLAALSARIQSERRGLLSLPAGGALTGGLSEVEGGGLSPANPGPESACQPDRPATDS